MQALPATTSDFHSKAVQTYSAIAILSVTVGEERAVITPKCLCATQHAREKCPALSPMLSTRHEYTES